MSKFTSLIKLFALLVITLGAGFLGSIFTRKSIQDWYTTLQKPVFSPPDWLFGPVWTILYILMAVAAFLVWQKGLENKQVRVALVLFFVQLAINVSWSLVFFGLQSPLGGVLVILALIAAIILTMVSFYKVTPIASYLLIPYLLWVAFATVLNISIWRLNA